MCTVLYAYATDKIDQCVWENIYVRVRETAVIDDNKFSWCSLSSEMMTVYAFALLPFHIHIDFQYSLHSHWKCIRKIDKSPKEISTSRVVGICWLIEKQSHDNFNWFLYSIFMNTTTSAAAVAACMIYTAFRTFLSSNGDKLEDFFLFQINQFTSKIEYVCACVSAYVLRHQNRCTRREKKQLNTVYIQWDDWYFRPMSLVNWKSNRNWMESEEKRR